MVDFPANHVWLPEGIESMVLSKILGINYPYLSIILQQYTSSTAQGGGGSFKNRKPIGEISCCESGMAERIHWWTERCLISLIPSLSFSDYLPAYLSSSMYLSIYRSIDLSISLSLNLSSNYLSIYLSISLSLSLSSVYLSSCLPLYLSIYLSVYLWCRVIQCNVVSCNVV